MPTLIQNLMGIVPLCEKGCSLIYNKAAVTVLSTTRKVILRGWREVTGTKLWRFFLLSYAQPGWHEGDQPPAPTSYAPEAKSAYNMPGMAALTR